MAERAISEHDNSKARAAWMLRTALGFPPKDADLDELVAAAAEFREVFERDAAGANRLVRTGDSEPDRWIEPKDLAAWTLVANTIMNRDDFINK
jgi:hypothetical protein